MPVLSQDEGAEQEAAAQADKLPDNAIWLESLDIKNMTSTYGEARKGKSHDWKPLTLKGVVYRRGIGTHANSQMTIDLKDAATKFEAIVGVDDEVGVGKGAVIFSIIVDGKEVFNSGVMKSGDEPKVISVDLREANRMVMMATLEKTDASGAHADWANAMLFIDPDEGNRPESVSLASDESAFKLPPLPPANPQPAIHGPRVIGASPRRPFLFLVPVTGKGPFTYSAARLPKGLQLDAKTGIISGQIEAAGTYDVTISVKGAAGQTRRILSIVCGNNKLALTPPMGWNAWNVFGETVTAAKVREQADFLIKSGLAARGYQYIIIDDTWQARRDADGNISPNKRFGDMKELADYIHSKGLKLGIYSSPNAETCSGYAGSEGYEEKDIALYASWGIDYLKYDWCEAGTKKDVSADELKPAYAKMRNALNKVNRDIIYDLSLYGLGKVWEWGAEIGANTWWTSAQIYDNWDSLKNNAFVQHDRVKFAGPGHWNNPGWLMVGRKNPTMPRFPRLRPSELMTQVTLWSLLASPLILSCDLGQLDPNNLSPVTTTLLSNEEVIAIDQDALGRPATRVSGWGDWEVWARPLLDGTTAVGLFNKIMRPQEITIKWSDLGHYDSQTFPVRDVWQRKDLGRFKDSFTATVPVHGAVMLKVGQPLSPSNQVQGWAKPAYLLSTWTWGDGLHWSYSRNGQEWMTFPRDKVWLKSNLPDKHMSNNSIVRGADGLHHMVYTAGGNQKGFGYTSSKNGLDWSDPVFIPVDKGVLSSGVKEVRQPDAFYDKKSKQFVIIWSAIAQPEPEKMRGPRLYAMTTKDFKTFSEPKLFFNPGYSCTHGSLVEAGGKHYLIFRDQDKRLIKMTYSSTPDVQGPYYIEADTLPTGKETDEPSINNFKGEWYLTFLRRGNPEIQGALKTRDFKKWDDITARMTFPRQRHFGSMISVSESTLQDMIRTSYQRD